MADRVTFIPMDIRAVAEIVEERDEHERWRGELGRVCEVQRGQLDNKDEEITALRVELNALKTALRPRLNGLLGALCGQGNELVDEMRAAIAVLDGECKETPSTFDSSPDNARLRDIPTEPRVWRGNELCPHDVLVGMIVCPTCEPERQAEAEEAARRHASRTQVGWNDPDWTPPVEVVEDQAGGGQP